MVSPARGWYLAALLAAASGVAVAEGELRVAVVICVGAGVLATYGQGFGTLSIAVPIVFTGCVVLAYGFSNVAAFRLAGTGIPLSTVLLAACLPTVVRGRPYGGVPTRALLALALMGLIRLAIDFPHYGTVALRDATWIGDTSAFFVGWAYFRQVGLDRWRRTLTVAFTATAVYALVMTSGRVSGFGPTVGLLKPVPLFASVSWYAVAGGLLFFLIVRPFRLATVAAAALAAAALQIQSRGLLVMIPVAFSAVYLAARHRWGRGVRRRLLIGTGTLAFVGAAVIVVAPSGRFGPTTGNVLESQFATLVGGTGPGSGSNASRFVFYKTTFAALENDPAAHLVGLGFGPDLAGGEAAGVSDDTRKPHNDFLEIYARMGVVALSLYVLFLASTVREILRGARQSRSAAAILLWTAGATITSIGLSLTQPGLAYPHFTVPLFLSLGAGVAIAREVARAGEEPSLDLRANDTAPAAEWD